MPRRVVLALPIEENRNDCNSASSLLMLYCQNRRVLHQLYVIIICNTINTSTNTSTTLTIIIIILAIQANSPPARIKLRHTSREQSSSDKRRHRRHRRLSRSIRLSTIGVVTSSPPTGRSSQLHRFHRSISRFRHPRFPLSPPCLLLPPITQPTGPANSPFRHLRSLISKSRLLRSYRWVHRRIFSPYHKLIPFSRNFTYSFVAAFSLSFLLSFSPSLILSFSLSLLFSLSFFLPLSLSPSHLLFLSFSFSISICLFSCSKLSQTITILLNSYV